MQLLNKGAHVRAVVRRRRSELQRAHDQLLHDIITILYNMNVSYIIRVVSRYVYANIVLRAWNFHRFVGPLLSVRVVSRCRFVRR